MEFVLICCYKIFVFGSLQWFYFKYLTSVSDLNAVGKDSTSVFGNINVVDKDAYRQYLYCLTPKYDSITGPKFKLDSIRVGILDIEWRSNLGEKGHLQTSMLQTVVGIIFFILIKSLGEKLNLFLELLKHNDRGDFRFSLTGFPNIVFLEKPFPVSCRITNISYV